MRVGPTTPNLATASPPNRSPPTRRTWVESFVGVLMTDTDGHARILRLAEQRGARPAPPAPRDRSDHQGKSCPKRVRLAVPPIIAAPRSPRPASPGEWRARWRPYRGPRPRRPPPDLPPGSARRETAPGDPAVEPRAQVRQGRLAERRRAVDHPLLDPAGVRDQHEHQPRGRQGEQLHVPHGRAGQRRILHDRDLPGQLREQPHRCGPPRRRGRRRPSEVLDGAPLGRGHRLDAGQLVDEEPVALVGRDAPGAGVRLGDEPLVLQGRHVIAHGGRGDAEVVPLGEGLGADRLPVPT